MMKIIKLISIIAACITAFGGLFETFSAVEWISKNIWWFLLILFILIVMIIIFIEWVKTKFAVNRAKKIKTAEIKTEIKLKKKLKNESNTS